MSVYINNAYFIQCEEIATNWAVGSSSNTGKFGSLVKSSLLAKQFLSFVFFSFIFVIATIWFYLVALPVCILALKYINSVLLKQSLRFNLDIKNMDFENVQENYIKYNDTCKFIKGELEKLYSAPKILGSNAVIKQIRNILNSTQVIRDKYYMTFNIDSSRLSEIELQEISNFWNSYKEKNSEVFAALENDRLTSIDTFENKVSRNNH